MCVALSAAKSYRFLQITFFLFKVEWSIRFILLARYFLMFLFVTIQFFMCAISQIKFFVTGFEAFVFYRMDIFLIFQ